MKIFTLFLLLGLGPFLVSCYATRCNDCYARTALELIKYYKPRSNLTINDVMRSSSQTCAGGTPERILKQHFSRVVLTTAGPEKLERIIRKYGRAIVGVTNKHLEVAVTLSDKGLHLSNSEIIQFPSNGRFSYVVYIRDGHM